MKHYSNYGFKEFIIATGHKKNIIDNFFRKKKTQDWNVKIIDTGKNTMTGGRLKKAEKYLQDEDSFCMTYGDGLADVNILNLIQFQHYHRRSY